MRLADIIVFYNFSLAKTAVFLDFKAIKQFKMRVLLEIRIFLEGEFYGKGSSFSKRNLILGSKISSSIIVTNFLAKIDRFIFPANLI